MADPTPAQLAKAREIETTFCHRIADGQGYYGLAAAIAAALADEAQQARQAGLREAEPLRVAVREYVEADKFHDHLGYGDCACNIVREHQHCRDVREALYALRQLVKEGPSR